MHITKSFFTLLLFIIAGALIGGILGQILGSISFSGLEPFFMHSYKVLDIENIHFNFGILQFHFGILFEPNLISILGIIIAVWLYKRF